MSYTLWSRGRLIGHTELAYRRITPGFRMGEFEATELGERLMPTLLGVDQAFMTFYAAAADARKDAKRRGEKLKRGEFPESVRNTTEYADAMSAQDELESLALELHDAGGQVVKTDWIQIKDAHRLAALGREMMMRDAEKLGIEIELEEPEPWEPEPPRYQISVMLEGGEKRMLRMAKRQRRSSSRDSDMP